MILCIFQGKSFTLINVLKDISWGPELLVLADSIILRNCTKVATLTLFGYLDVFILLISPNFTLCNQSYVQHIQLFSVLESLAQDPTSKLLSDINPLKTKRRLLYLKTQFVPRSKHFSSRL